MKKKSTFKKLLVIVLTMVFNLSIYGAAPALKLTSSYAIPGYASSPDYYAFYTMDKTDNLSLTAGTATMTVGLVTLTQCSTTGMEKFYFSQYGSNSWAFRHNTNGYYLWTYTVANNKMAITGLTVGQKVVLQMSKGYPVVVSETGYATALPATVTTNIDGYYCLTVTTAGTLVLNFPNGRNEIEALAIYTPSSSNNAVYFDENTYSAPNAETAYSSITLLRKLKTTWNTLCLPFSMTTDQITETFGSGATIAKLSGVESGVLQFTTTDRTISSGVPCLISVANECSQWQIGNVTVGTSATTTDVSQGEATLKGIYSPITATTGTAGTGLYTMATANNRAYFISNGVFYYADETSYVTLNGFRAYMLYSQASESKQLNISVDGAEVTKIDGLTTDNRFVNGNIFNLNGQLIRKNSTTTESLPKGIYIVNGKKYIVK